MHVSAYQFFEDRAAALPHSRFVVEVGGRDVNGSIRDLFSADRYLCIDLHPGANVDIVADAMVWRPTAAPDLVLCAEVLEHVPQPGLLVSAMRRWLAPGGVLLLATVGHPWPEHSGYDGGPLRPGEYYGGIEYQMFANWMDLFREYSYECGDNGDRFLVGIKAGPNAPKLADLWPAAVPA
jgi:SAM-dependent methyltransferase